MGVEERGAEVFLLLLDPLHSPRQVRAVLEDPTHRLRLLRKSVNELKHKEYEIMLIDGILSDKEKQVSNSL